MGGQRAVNVRVWVVVVLGALTLNGADLRGQGPLSPSGDSVVFQSDGMTIRIDIVATGLMAPSGLDFLPNGRGLLVERGTPRMSLVDVEGGVVTPVGGLPPVTRLGDGGLHDVQVHPDFQTNGWVYFTYTTRPEGALPSDSTTVLGLARGTLVGSRLESVEILLTTTPGRPEAAHYGGRLALADGYVFVSLGDRRHRPGPQDLTAFEGKILRLGEDGSIPSDNPFSTHAGAGPAVWSYGHRNPQGLTFHPTTGELWSTEHGPQGGDEVNLILPGRNYGWPVVSYGEEYEGGPIGTGRVSGPGIEGPRYYFRPSIATAGADFYSGRAFPAWQGDLFMGALGMTHLNRLVVREERVLREDRLLEGREWRVRVVREGPDGALYIGVDAGMLLRLSPG